MDLRDDRTREYQDFRADKRARCIDLLISVLPDGDTLDAAVARVKAQFEVDDCERLVAAIANLKRIRSANPSDDAAITAAETEVAWAAIRGPISISV